MRCLEATVIVSIAFVVIINAMLNMAVVDEIYLKSPDDRLRMKRYYI